MKKCILSVLVLTLFAGMATSMAFNISDVINKIPDEERFEFVKYHIQKGYELVTQLDENLRPLLKENLPILESGVVTDTFSILLYIHAKNQALVTDKETLRLLREVICFQDGACIDLGDIGVHP